jgi:hypothetical protein
MSVVYLHIRHSLSHSFLIADTNTPRMSATDAYSASSSSAPPSSSSSSSPASSPSPSLPSPSSSSSFSSADVIDVSKPFNVEEQCYYTDPTAAFVKLWRDKNNITDGYRWTEHRVMALQSALIAAGIKDIVSEVQKRIKRYVAPVEDAADVKE